MIFFVILVSVFFQLGKKCPFIQQIFGRNLSGKASTCHIKPKFHHINERLNIPCFFSRFQKQFLIVSYVGLKLGAPKDGNIPLVV